MSTRRALAIAAVGALSLSLAACDPGEAEEVDPPTTSSAAPTSEAPTSEAPATTEAPTAEPATAPAVPPPNPADFPGMDQQTEEGAKQAYRYFWAAIVYGYQTGDASILEDMTGPNCGYCVTTRDDITKHRDAGALWGPASTEVLLIESEYVNDANILVDYGFNLGEHYEHNVETGMREDKPLTRYVTSGRAIWVDGKWRIDGLAIKS